MTWWYRLWHRTRMDEQLEKELRFHLDEHTRDLVAQGHDPREAARLARLALGGLEQVTETCREQRGTGWLVDLAGDVRYALRALRHSPGFAATAIATLALGVGATTVMFTIVNAVLLAPLPYVHPEQLVALEEETDWSTPYGNRWAFAYPNYLDCERESQTLELAAWRYSGGTVSGSGDPEYVDGLAVSAQLFPVLGISLTRGRPFLVEEDRPGGAPVALISQALWRRRFGGDEAAIGSRVVFEGKPRTIIGILPAGFQAFGEADVFTPLGQDADARLQNREVHPGIRVYGRLRAGTTLGQARAELYTMARQLSKQYPRSNKGRTFVMQPLKPQVGDARSTLWLLLGAVTLVLLIACANVASLLLARGAARERELAMRAALGASRNRLVRQCLTESAVLALFGGGLGVVLASAGVRPLVVLWPGSVPRLGEAHVDWHVLLFALSVSLLCSVLFGLAPALRVPSRGLDDALRSGGRTLGGVPRRLHGAFVASEIALAVVLLVCAGVLGRALLSAWAHDPGLDVRNVLVARTALSPGALANPAQTRAAWAEVLDSARSVPGVRSVALVDTVPMREGYNELTYSTTPGPQRAGERPVALATCVTPDYLRVMRIPLLAGRFFDDRDHPSAQPVIVVDEVLARAAFPGRQAVGRKIWIPDLNPAPLEIAGVVGHVRHWGLASDDQARVRAQVYYPFAQLHDRFLRRWSELMSIAVRSDIPPLSVLEPLRHRVRGAAGDQVVYEVRTLEQLASSSLDRQRFLLFLFGIFATVALLLASIGIYGVLAYLTSRRVPEIGLRVALGASGADVTRLVVRQSLGMTLAGVCLGTVGALAAARTLERLVEGVRAVQPATFGVMIALLVAAALVAAFIPARRASRVDVMTALRQD